MMMTIIYKFIILYHHLFTMWKTLAFSFDNKSGRLLFRDDR
jgi:hypothetical protein